MLGVGKGKLEVAGGNTWLAKIGTGNLSQWIRITTASRYLA